MSNRSKVNLGAFVDSRELVTIHSERVRIPDSRNLVHLQFRRFAGCPVCNLHLHSITQRYNEILAASIREVVVFHSSVEELLRHASDLPFAVVADPEKRLYREFGVEAAPKALLDPRAWPAILRGITRDAAAVVRGTGRVPSLDPTGGRLGLPADFLIANDGRVLACKYGNHVYDQWSVDQILAVSRLNDSARGTRGQVCVLIPERRTVYEHQQS